MGSLLQLFLLPGLLRRLLWLLRRRCQMLERLHLRWCLLRWAPYHCEGGRSQGGDGWGSCSGSVSSTRDSRHGLGKQCTGIYHKTIITKDLYRRLDFQ